MKQHFKDQFVYLTFALMFCYLGTFFIDRFTSVDQSYFFFSEWFTLLLILVNAIVILILAQKFTNDRWTAFIAAMIYLVSPLHLDVFILPFQLQFLIAETILLFYILAYVKNFFNIATLLLILATTLNFKLIALMPFIWASSKFSTKQKTYSAVSFFVLLTFLYPLWGDESAIDNLRTVVYMFESLLIPFNISFLNYAIIVPGYYSGWFLAVFVILMAGISLYIYKSQFKNVALILSIISCSLLSIFIPSKNLMAIEDSFFYFTPTLYPCFLVSIVGISLFIMIKFKGKNSRIIISCILLMWLGVSISLQKEWHSVVGAWEAAMMPLPQRFYYDEMIKYKWANLLIEKGQDSRAETLVVDAKSDFRNERWYRLHLNIAIKKKDDATIDRIYDDLIRLKIPYADERKLQKRRY